MNFLEILWKRIKSETPKFWKKIMYFSLSMSASLIALRVSVLEMEFINSPSFIKIMEYLIVAFSTIAAVAKATTTDQKIMEE